MECITKSFRAHSTSLSPPYNPLAIVRNLFDTSLTVHHSSPCFKGQQRHEVYTFSIRSPLICNLFGRCSQRRKGSTSLRFQDRIPESQTQSRLPQSSQSTRATFQTLRPARRPFTRRFRNNISPTSLDAILRSRLTLPPLWRHALGRQRALTNPRQRAQHPALAHMSTPKPELQEMSPRRALSTAKPTVVGSNEHP